MSTAATTPSRVALATCAERPGLDVEGGLLLAALERRGLIAQPAVWDDPAVAWSAFDLVVVRETWDYAERVTEFVAWAERVSSTTRLLNDLALLRWSSDKRYLKDLADAGVGVVPSTFLAPGEPPEHDWLRVAHVVKPSVGAGSRGALRVAAEEPERSRDHVRALHGEGRTALVQPYLHSVDTHGETALVYLDGYFSHALRKGALLSPGAGLVEGLFAPEEMSVRTPSEAELAVGAACLAALPAPGVRPLYARVDLLAGGAGPVVLEVELVEPSLFLDHVPGAADRLASAIEARLR